MERLLNDDLANQIKDMLNVMKEKVVITFFNKENNEGSSVTNKLLTEISSLNNLIELNVYNYDENLELANSLNVTTAPAFLMTNEGLDARGVFYGVPAGHEINTLLATIIDVSKANPLFEDKILKQIDNISEPMNVKVFVTTQCPHCPGAAINALRLAYLNNNITAEVYEVHSNMEIAQKYNVSGVPKIVINDKKELVGNQPITEFLK